MADKTQPTTDTKPVPSIEAVALPAPAEIASISDTAIDRLVTLGAESRGVDIVTITAPDTMVGVPETIQVAIVHGEAPKVTGLEALFEPYRTAPARKKGTAKALTLKSFIELVDRHATDETAVFADTDWRKPALTAVIDYHEASTRGAADFGQHRVRYDFPLSEPWKVWMEANGKPMEQADFASFIEDRVADLSSPEDFEREQWEKLFNTTLATPSQLIQLSRGLQVHVASKVVNAVTLQSGEGQLVFEETHHDAAGNRLTVPGLFILQIEPFFMGERIRIPCRLRYRVKAGTIVWFFQVYRPDQFITERVRADLDVVARDTGLPCFEGAPEMAA